MAGGINALLQGLQAGQMIGAPIQRYFERKQDREQQLQDQESALRNHLLLQAALNPDLANALTQIQKGQTVDGQESVKPLPFTQDQQNAIDSGKSIPEEQTLNYGGIAFSPNALAKNTKQTEQEGFNNKLKLASEVEKMRQGYASEAQLNEFKQQRDLAEQKYNQASKLNDQDNAAKYKLEMDALDKKIQSGVLGTGATGGLTQEAVDLLADRFGTTGEIPALGMGKGATAARVQLFNKAAENLSNSGQSAQEQLANQSQVKATQGGLKKLETQRATVMAFANTADKNLDIVDQLSDKVGNGGVPILNKWVNAGKRSITGDADLAKYDAAVRTAINEYAKVVSSATGGGVTSDSARQEVEAMLNSAQTPEQVRSVISLLRQELGNRRAGYDDQINQMKESISGKKGSDKESKSDNSVAPGSIVRQNGKVYRFDGKNYIEVK